MMLSRGIVPFTMAGALSIFGACASMQQIGNAVSKGQVLMYNVSGSLIGTGDIWQDKNGLVHVDIATISLPTGSPWIMNPVRSGELKTPQ